MPLSPRFVGERPTGLVLVAESDHDLREIVSGYLEAKGWRVVAVGNGPEAVERAVREELAAVVLDVRTSMPWELGVLRRLRAVGSTVPIIVITSFGDSLVSQEARRLGATQVLEKPFDLEALDRAMQECT